MIVQQTQLLYYDRRNPDDLYTLYTHRTNARTIFSASKNSHDCGHNSVHAPIFDHGSDGKNINNIVTTTEATDRTSATIYCATKKVRGRKLL